MGSIDGVRYGSRDSGKYGYRPKVVVKDLVTGEVKRIIPARKYKLKEKYVKHLDEMKPKRVVSATVIGSNGAVDTRSTYKHFFGKKIYY